MLINVHSFLPRSTENGPGLRAVVWVQGCTLQCPGCFNPGTHDLAPRTMISAQTLATQISQIEGLEGITISGGEPFLQARALAELGQEVKQHQLGMVVFSGFSFEQLGHSPRPDWKALLTCTDLLIAGPFIQEQVCHLPLRGSANQTLHFLTNRYTYLQESLQHETNRVEIIIDPAGQTIITGFPDGSLYPANAAF